MTHERRADQRACAEHSVLMQVEAPGGPHAVIETTTDDFSSSAFRCICDQPLDPFARVQVVIKLPASDPSDPGAVTAIECDGVVVRRERIVNADGAVGDLVAVFLDHTTPEQRGALDKAVARCLSGAEAPVVRAQ